MPLTMRNFSFLTFLRIPSVVLIITDDKTVVQDQNINFVMPGLLERRYCTRVFPLKRVSRGYVKCWKQRCC